MGPGEGHLEPSVLARRLEPAVVRSALEARVPGVVVGLAAPGADMAFVHHGVRGTSDRRSVDADTRFLIGSVSKVHTATALMGAVREGTLDLDQPITRWIPELRTADASVGPKLTLRLLMSHRGGFEGDYDADLGRGGDALDRLPEVVAVQRQHLPPGGPVVYSNLGWDLAGLVLQRATGMPFEDVVRSSVFDPLGMTDSGFLPEEVFSAPLALGHASVDGTVQPVPWWRPRCRAPNGGVISTARNQLRFALGHLAAFHGRSSRLPPSPELYHLGLDPGPLGDSMGLGFITTRIDGVELVGHDGLPLGFFAHTSFIPSRDVALTVLTNADTGAGVVHAVIEALIEQLTGRPPEPLTALPAGQDRVAEFAGVYRNEAPTPFQHGHGGETHVAVVDGSLMVRSWEGNGRDPEWASAIVTGPDTMAVGTSRVGARRGDFLRTAEGRIRWMRWGAQLLERVGDVPDRLANQ
jgi:CubicO group peptidase (beta-lactamase class C family)